jgi:pyruvate kinase
MCRPATAEAEDIIKLFDAGMACARFNMSHGSAKVSALVKFSTKLIDKRKTVSEVSGGQETETSQDLRSHA